MNKFLSLFADHQHKRSFNLAQKYSKIATRLETSPILFPIHTIATAFYCTDQHSIQNKKEKEKYRQKKIKEKRNICVVERILCVLTRVLWVCEKARDQWRMEKARAGITIVIQCGTNKRAGSRFDRSSQERAVAFDCRARP